MFARLLASWVELYAEGLVLLAAIKAVKFDAFPHLRPLGPRDHLSWAAAALVFAGAVALAPLPLAIPVVLAGLLLFVGLWLDAALYRVFTIELGPGELGSVVLAVLYRELSEIELGRRFFAHNRVFVLVPAAALAAFAQPLVARVGTAGVATAAALAGYLVALVVAVRPPLVGRHREPSILRSFLLPRPLPLAPDFAPRSEHARLLDPRPEVPPPSARHGALKGANVLLVTVESLGRAHLGAVDLPALARLARRGVVAKRHYCISPTTNNAHTALYFGGYLPSGESAVAWLGAAGFRTVYLTTIHTSLYGLGRLLRQTGFDRVVGAEDLRPRPGRTTLDDWVLVEAGVEVIAAAARAGRFFAHVHTTETHVPYRVVEPRYRRRPADGDRGRFLDGLEEADAIVAALLDHLGACGLLDDTLVVLSGDHGQSFGELGYWSHASAVTAEQVDVPAVFAHPRLVPAEVEASSHFDVLPTVLDLLGLAAPPSLGASVFLGRELELFLWAGQPSRSSTSCFGVIHGRRKRLVDVVTGRCLEMDWDDRDPVELEGAERRYWQGLCSAALVARGLR